MDFDRQKLAAYCPLCGAKPVRVDARVLGESGDAQLVHATCRRCAASMLTLTLVRPGSAGAVGLVTDLSAEDAIRFAHGPAVSTNDVLRVHECVKAPLSSWIPAGTPSPSSVPATRPHVSRRGAKKPARAPQRKSRRA